MKALYRRVFKNQNTGIAAIRELLQMMFIGEFLINSERVWVVSPWVGNIVLIDNRAGCFDALNPEWGRREIRLIDVLLSLMSKGAEVLLVTRKNEINEPFLIDIKQRSIDSGVRDQLKIVTKQKLHTKGVLLSESLLLGSMNLTYSGLEINDEWIQYSIDREDIAKTRLEFDEYLNNE
jgi:phosphatidylserine/phosphatidylglycerophosphate/cardiolipin synthase-like enzyme